MPRIEEHIRIERPVQDVFAFATDPDNQTTVWSNMISYDQDGPTEKGVRTHGVTKVAGKRVEWTSEVTEFQPGRRMEIRSIDSPMDFHITWNFSAEGSGTRVDFVQEVGSLGGFFGRLGDPVVTRMYARDVRANLEHLKELLEED